jgi:hypothetical protein
MIGINNLTSYLISKKAILYYWAKFITSLFFGLNIMR